MIPEIKNGVWIYKKCIDCEGYSKIKRKCVADDGIPDGSGYACENFKVGGK